MDDYSISSLQESRNEWCSRLINIITPLVMEGFKSIFDESWKLCQENDETDKYLMTFQNFLARIPKWNPTIVTQETERIVEKSNCGYLTDLISCVHIIQLKSLTCMRVGNKQKKVDINMPSLNDFIHKVYINSARKVYTNIYLFEINISPLQIQKHRRELELIIREEVLNSIRENVPVEDILKVYLDETVEEDIEVEEKEEIISTEPVIEEEKEDVVVEEDVTKEEDLEIKPLVHEEITKDSIKFNDVDEAISIDNIISEIEAPKTEERLDQISNERNEARKLEEMEDEEEEDKIKIGAKINLSELDVHDLEKPKTLNKVPLGLEEIEILV
tara:strand:- start:88 stop:1080 length:993 start_codon:yes stop_codon:yes gene_type:complete